MEEYICTSTGKKYCLQHLKTHQLLLRHDGLKYNFTVYYSNHVYTAGNKTYASNGSEPMNIGTNEYPRFFDLSRYEQSKKLKRITYDFGKLKFVKENKGDFFSFLTMPEDSFYEIYIKIKKKKSRWAITVRSAYTRTHPKPSKRDNLEKNGKYIFEHLLQEGS